MKYALPFFLFFLIGCAQQEVDYASMKEDQHREEAEIAKQKGDVIGQIENLHKANQYEEEKNDAEIEGKSKWGPFYYLGWVLEQITFHNEISVKKEY